MQQFNLTSYPTVSIEQYGVILKVNIVMQNATNHVTGEVLFLYNKTN